MVQKKENHKLSAKYCYKPFHYFAKIQNQHLKINTHDKITYSLLTQQSIMLLSLTCLLLLEKAQGRVFRGQEGLGPINNPTTILNDGSHHFKHQFENTHDHLGTTSFSYDAIVPTHVKSIDAHPAILDITCTADSLHLHLDDNSDNIVDDIEVGDILVASADYGCHTHKPSGRHHGRHTNPHAVYRRVTSIDKNVLQTKIVQATDCFKSSDIQFTWTPPFHGLHPNDAANKRRLQNVDLDTLIAACKAGSTLNWRFRYNLQPRSR